MDNGLKDLLADVFAIPVGDITPELTKENVGAWDSLKQMDLVISIERKYNITLEISDIVSMDSVSSIIDVL